MSEANLANAELSAQATLAADYFDLRAADSLRALLTRAVALESARARHRAEPTEVRHRDQRRCGRGAGIAGGHPGAARRRGTAARHVRARHRRAHRPSALGAQRRGGAARGDRAAGSGIRAIAASRAQSGHRGGGASNAGGERPHRCRDRRLLSDDQPAGARRLFGESVVDPDQRGQSHLVRRRLGERRRLSGWGAGCRRGASARDL